jgi:CDP-diacylglycerol--serine O-phosphatidyltransferase
MNKKKLIKLPLSRLFPNFITLAALCAGMCAIKASLSTHWQEAITFTILAAFLDGMDGRLARFLKATSNFGAQLDSLSDFLNFGVAPAFILYLWKLQYIEIPSIGWAIALFLSVCMSLRLARYNNSLDDETKPIWAERFFVGVPAPAAACLLLLPMILALHHEVEVSAIVVGIYSFIIALLMVSRIPTFSIKKITISKDLAWVAMIIAALLVTSLVIKPWLTIMMLGMIYLASIPFSIIYYMKLSKEEYTRHE